MAHYKSKTGCQEAYQYRFGYGGQWAGYDYEKAMEKQMGPDKGARNLLIAIGGLALLAAHKKAKTGR